MGRKGPKYQRYFYAYSDRMIVNAMIKPTTLIQLATTGTPFFSIIPTLRGMITIDLPKTRLDTSDYGVIILQEGKLEEFLDRGPQHQIRRLRPREENASPNLTYCENFELNHQNLGDLGEDLSGVYKGKVVLPFRSLSHEEFKRLLEEKDFRLEASTSYEKNQHLPLQTVGFPAIPETNQSELKIRIYKLL